MSYNLPQPKPVGNSKNKEHRRLEISDEGVRALFEEGLNQHLYLDGRPGTANRVEIKLWAVWLDNGRRLELSATVDTWVEQTGEASETPPALL